MRRCYYRNHSSMELKCFIFNWIIYHDFHLYFFDIIILFLYRSKSWNYLHHDLQKKELNCLLPIRYISATSHITYYILYCWKLFNNMSYFPPKWFCISALCERNQLTNNKRKLLYYHSGYLIYLHIYMKLFYKYFDFCNIYTHSSIITYTEPKKQKKEQKLKKNIQRTLKRSRLVLLLLWKLPSTSLQCLFFELLLCNYVSGVDQYYFSLSWSDLTIVKISFFLYVYTFCAVCCISSEISSSLFN